MPDFIGDNNSNIIRGTNLNDFISGLGGNDTLIGLDGNDTMVGGGGGDTLTAGNGNDSLSGGSSFDDLLGGPGNDKLSGGSENDKLNGESGADRMTGGSGFDIFNFRSSSASGSLGAGNRDVITDFVRGQDIIDLFGIDAKANTSGNQSFTPIGAQAFTAEGQVRFISQVGSTQGTLVQMNTSGTSGAEIEIELQNTLFVTDNDFVF